MRNKKASIIFSLGLVFTTLVILILAFITLTEKLKDYPAKVGERQAELLKTYQRAESALFYIDESAKLSAYQSIYDLAADGGYYSDSACGSYFGYELWNNKSDKCYPDAKKSFSEFMKENLDFYTTSFVPENNYIFIINPNQIIGLAINNIEAAIEIEGDIMLVKEECDMPALVDITEIPCTSSVPNGCKINKKTFEKLKQADILARSKGYQLLVKNAYRPYSVQWDWYVHGPPGRPEWAYDRSKVAKPSCTAPHVTGMAVDVVFDRIDMGSEPVYAKNEKREKLQEIMCEAGFVRYGDTGWTTGEYWHYEYGTSRWERGKNLRKCAIR